jgi:hypothetical protein
MIPVYVVDAIKNVVAATSAKLLSDLQAIEPLIQGIQFDYGHYTDIKERLKAKSQTDKTKRFPLICLFEDHRIRHQKLGITGIADLKIIILYPSKNTVTREWRETNVFRPILYPIYFEFLRQLKLCGQFNIYDETKIQHDQINRPHWGDPALYKNDSYLFGEILDGIELNNLQLETFLNNCQSNRLVSNF